MEKAARVEIYWAYLTVTRNLNFNMSTYFGEYMPHIFDGSKVVGQAIINRLEIKQRMLLSRF